MSNFRCQHCGVAIYDSPLGYTTGCTHYPMDPRMERWMEVSRSWSDARNAWARTATEDDAGRSSE